MFAGCSLAQWARLGSAKIPPLGPNNCMVVVGTHLKHFCFLWLSGWISIQIHSTANSCDVSPNSVSTLRGSYGKRKGLGARLRCPLWPRAFCVVFTADSCSCLMSKCVLTAQARTKSVLRGIYRRFVLLLDVEMRRFDRAGSHKVRCRLLSASVSRGIYRRFLLLLDVEVRFDCAGSHKLVFYCFFGGSRGQRGFCLVVRRHGFPAKCPGLDSRPVRASLFPFLWACMDGASVLRRRLGNSNSNREAT